MKAIVPVKAVIIFSYSAFFHLTSSPLEPIYFSGTERNVIPDWYHNLVAHPQVAVELGTEQFEATAVLIEGEERDQIYAKETQVHPGAADYEKKTARKIPVMELVRRNSSR